MACDCKRPKECQKLICCGVCPDRDDCPYKCPTCTSKSEDDDSNDANDG